MTKSNQNVRQLLSVLDDIVAQVRDRAPDLYEKAVATAEEHDSPSPRRSDFNRFGIAIFTREGELVKAGNAGVGFPIQSISKVFALEVALEALGEALWRRVGREPSGDAFNSIIDLERNKGIPRNPFINAGALVVCDMLLELSAGKPKTLVMRFVEELLDGEAVIFDEQVMKSDRRGGDLN